MKNYTNQCFRKKYVYKDYFFWANKIIKEQSLYEGYFDNKSITKESKIIYTGILDSKKGILKCGWPFIHLFIVF